MQEIWVQFLGWEDPLEKEMATYSSILTWRISWTEEPGGLQFMGLQRVGHDLATKPHHPLQCSWAFPGGSGSKNLPATGGTWVQSLGWGDLGSIPELGRSPGGGHGNPLQYSGLENPHVQRSLADYSPWGHRELDTTERLSTAQQHS